MLDASGNVLARSPIHFNAAVEETIDVTIPSNGSTRSEMDRYLADLTPVLGDVDLGDLVEQDLAFLNGETRIPIDHLRMLSRAASLAARFTGADPGTGTHAGKGATAIPAEAFYGWFRLGFPTDADALWDRGVEPLVAALGTAIARNLVPATLSARLDAIRAALALIMTARRLAPAAPGAPASVGDLLRTIPSRLPPAREAIVAGVVATTPPADPAFERRLREAGMAQEEIVSVRRTLRAGELTRGHAPLVEALQPRLADDADASLRPLAALRRHEWLDLAYAHGVPPAAGLSPQAYARDLERTVEAMHPTPALAVRVAEGALASELPALAALPAFLARNAAFDVRTANLDTLARDADFGDLAERERADLVGSLRTLQRLNALSATWEEAEALVRAGIRSGADVVGLGRNGFEERIRGAIPADRAAAIHERARTLQDTSVAVMAAVTPRFGKANSIAVFDPSAKVPRDGELEDRPTLRSLFGDLDRCACRHCQSVLSPAAYLVDILRLVEARPSALRALLARRPDVVDLELSCENTETELPYLDLVLEVLENAVALPLAIDAPPGTSLLPANPATKTATLPQALTDALRRTALDVAGGLTATREEREFPLWATAQWSVQDRRRRWTLYHARRSLFIPAARGRVLPVELSLGTAELDQLVGALDDGRVPANLAGAFGQFLLAAAFPSRHGILEATNVRVEMVEPGSAWKVTFQPRGRVKVLQDAGGGTLSITSAGGATLLQRRYSPKAALATVGALDSNRVGGVLEALLPDGSYQVEKPAESEWDVSSPETTVMVRHQREALTVTALAYQSSSPDADLKAAPENRSPEAYHRLAAAEFPWSLPFDLPLAEIRAFMERLGLPRLRAMELLKPAGRFADDAIAREGPGLSGAQATLAFQAETAPALWARWGLEVEAGTATVVDASVDESVRDAPLALLSRVSILLQQARLGFAELQDVLQTSFVQDASKSVIRITPLTECAPSKMTLQGLTAEHLDAIHRFVRLRRALGWQAHELDQALAAVQAGPAAALPRRLSHVARLTRMLGLPVDVVASWWGGLGGRIYRAHTRDGAPELVPLYDRVFLNRRVRNPPDEDLLLDPSRAALAGAKGKKLGEKAALLAASLGVRQDDLSRVVEHLGESRAGATDDLTLENLSTLHGVVTLCRALTLPIEDYLRILRLGGIAPFDGTEEMLELCELVQRIRSSGFAPAEVAYILRHDSTPGLDVELADDRIARILMDVRAAVGAFRDGALQSAEPVEARVRSQLVAGGWTTADADALVSALAGTAEFALPDDPELLGAFALPPELAGSVQLAGRMLRTIDYPPEFAFHPEEAASLYAAVPDNHPAYAAYEAAVDELAKHVPALRSAGEAALQKELTVGSGARRLFDLAGAKAVMNGTAPAARFSGVLARLVELRQPEIALPVLAAALSIDERVAADVLFHRLPDRTPGSQGRPEIERILDGSFLDASEEVTRARLAAAFDLVVRLHKSGVLLSRLGVTADELAWLAAPATPDAMIGLALDALPATSPAPEAASFPDWLRTVTLFGLRARAQRMNRLLAACAAALAAGDLTAFRAALANGFTLGPGEIAKVEAALGIASLDDRRDPLKLEQLLDLLTALSRTGASVEQLQALAAPAPDLETARVARGLLRAKHGAASWHDLLKSVSDPLRTAQRDALVDYLVGRPDAASSADGRRTAPRDANGLFERLLIDVQMAPCMQTTRLLQAIAAVQLFVQRCLMNLEPGVPPSDFDAEQWRWMKSYRVWEANRKVFLYPENWLFPEVRDDKTAAFRTLEGALSADEPSHERAKDALVGYLDELNELAQVNVVGMWDEQPSGSSTEQALYVVGRSPNRPYRYFWRKCLAFGEAGMRWNGWEPIDVGIEGEHVVPFVFEGDFHVAWPAIRRVQADGTPDAWEVQLAWARRTAKGWTQKKMSRDVFRVPVMDGKDEAGMFSFRAKRSLATSGFVDGGSSAADDAVATETVEITCYVAQRPRGGEDRTIPIPSVRAEYPTNYHPGSLTVAIRTHKQYTDKKYGPWPSVRVNVSVPSSLGIIEESVTTDETGYGRVTVDLLTYSEGNRTVTLWVDGEVHDMLPLPVTGNVTPARATATLEPGFRTYTAEAHFVVETTETPPELPVWPERPVEMIATNVFELRGGDDVALRPADGGRLPLLDGTYVYASGYQETSTGNADALELPVGGTMKSVFGATPASFFATQAHPASRSRIWYSRDQEGRYFHDLRPGSPLVLTELSPALVGATRAVSSDVAAVTSPRTQRLTDGGAHFAEHQPALAFSPRSIEEERFSFEPRAPHAIYGWELFLHAPVLAGESFTEQQRFEDAQRWLHLVFDPTSDADRAEGGARCWRFLPFRTDGPPPSIDRLFELLVDPSAADQDRQDFLDQIAAWRAAPFRPHAVARLRPSAYQWRTIFAYLDNLIAWGDQLFQRDTRESLNEATQLYVLAARMLGPRPRTIARQAQPPPMTYRGLAGRWTEFSEAWYAFADHPLLKSWLELQNWLRQHGVFSPLATAGEALPLASLGTLYFCVPENDKLLAYWDTVEDRLFKIRHCRNFEGVERALSLFEAPIDPALLVRAAAAGVDIESVLSDRAAPTPAYRFSVLAQKATELCQEVKALGSALLSSLEKEDAEKLALIRSGNEVALLRLVRDVRERQLDEARRNLDALRVSRKLVADRYRQYQRLLGKGEALVPPEGGLASQEELSLSIVPATALSLQQERGLGMIRGELDQLYRLKEAQYLAVMASAANTAAGLLFGAGERLVPWGHRANALASALSGTGGFLNGWATTDAIVAGYERRKNDWAFQSNLAGRELQQIDKQIAAGELRVAIAEHELRNHDRQTEQSEKVDAFMREKYTRAELYGWMVRQTSAVYFRSYQLAHAVAKRAERALRHELGLEDSSYVAPGYWDSLKKGLLAGEHLLHDVKRMEVAYLDQNRREYELTKHVSLDQLDPVALVKLKETGSCEFKLPEALFDVDCPGHYFRRLKAVSLSVPCVTGPYAGVHCTLTFLGGELRRSAALEGGYARRGDDDGRFTDSHAAIQSVVTSSGQNDSGLFEPGLRDERFLPFEGEGAISAWRLSIPKEFATFDHATLSDVILHVRYTAREGGESLRAAAVSELQGALNALVRSSGNGLARAFSLRHEFPTEWYRFLNPPSTTGDQHLTVPLTQDRFPFLVQGRKLSIKAIELYVSLDPKFAAEHDLSELNLSFRAGTTPADATDSALSLKPSNGLFRSEVSLPDAGAPPGEWTLAAWLGDSKEPERLDPKAITDVIAVCSYALSTGA